MGVGRASITPVEHPSGLREERLYGCPQRLEPRVLAEESREVVLEHGVTRGGVERGVHLDQGLGRNPGRRRALRPAPEAPVCAVEVPCGGRPAPPRQAVPDNRHQQRERESSERDDARGVRIGRNEGWRKGRTEARQAARAAFLRCHDRSRR